MDWSAEQARAVAAATHAAAPPPAGGLRIDVGQTGDHAPVYALLRLLNQAPRHEDFLSGLDEPSYEPSDRLLSRSNQSIVGHVQVLHRSAWFHGVKLPVAGLVDFAVLPEWQSSGHAEQLLKAAESAMSKGDAVVGLVETASRRLFEEEGWRAVAAQGFSQVNVQELLALLTAKTHRSSRIKADDGILRGQVATRAESRQPLCARPWRQIERRQVRAMYDAYAATCWGAVARSDSYWHWLIGRHSGYEIDVATDRSNSDQGMSALAGYAVSQGSRILEIAKATDATRACTALLMHVCQNAVERGHRTLTLHVPASDPLHELVVIAGGGWCGGESEKKCLMAKLFDAPRWIEAMYPILRFRARVAGVRLPIEIVFETDEAQFLVTVSRRGSRLMAADGRQVDVQCSRTTWEQLLIGNVGRPALIPPAFMQFRNETVRNLVGALFPPVLFWQSDFDRLRS
jgi:GNAT superfamily N-acetyltransferase